MTEGNSNKTIFIKAVKASSVNRVIAKFIDIVIFALIVLVFQMIWSIVGVLLGLAYILCCDGVNGGRSLGKMLMGLKVIDTESGLPSSLMKSLLRNLPLGIFALFASLPPWGWLLALFVGLPVVLLELYMVIILESGRRIGDVLADTKVLDLENGSGDTRA